MSTSVRDRLIGTWQLLFYISYPPSNPADTIYPLGPAATGTIIYHPHGYMSAHLQNPTVPKFPNADPYHPSNRDCDSPEMQVIGPVHGTQYIGYAGQFNVETRMVEGKEAVVVKHEVFNSSFPNWLDGVQERMANFETGEGGEEVLVLGTEGLGAVRIGADGKGRVVRVRWRKLPVRG